MATRQPRLRPEIRVATSAAELEGHYRVRHQVFVEEQRIFLGDDRDAWDGTAIHAVAVLGPIVVGAVRLYRLDESGLWQGDRLAVLPEARRLRPGGELVKFAVTTAGEHGGTRMVAHVQEPNVAFFQHLGWSRTGPFFDYHAVPHQRMDIPLSGAAEFSQASYDWALGG
jgi:putative N-acetyltransferase (TIGR04045 family)